VGNSFPQIRSPRGLPAAGGAIHAGTDSRSVAVVTFNADDCLKSRSFDCARTACSEAFGVLSSKSVARRPIATPYDRDMPNSTNNTTPTEPRRVRSAPIDSQTQARLSELIGSIGERELANRLNLSVNTLARIVAGMRITRGTRALLQEALARLDEQAAA